MLRAAVSRTPWKRGWISAGSGPVYLGSQTLWTGSYLLSTTLTSTGATYTINPASWSPPMGTNLQYRLKGTFAGFNAGDQLQFAQKAGSFYTLTGQGYTTPWVDATTNSHDLSMVGTVACVSSPGGSAFGNAASFPGGANNYLAGPVLFIGNPGATLEFMFQRTRVGVEEGMTANSEFSLIFLTNNKLQFTYQGTSSVYLTTAAAITDTNRHWFAASWDGITMRFYVDGALAASSNVPPVRSLANIGGNLIVGSYSSSGFPFAGLIDEMRFSNVARYTSNYTVPTSPFIVDNNTLALWHFENGTVPSTLTITTGWTLFPSAQTNTLYAANLTEATGTMTSLVLEAQAA